MSGSAPAAAGEAAAAPPPEEPPTAPPAAGRLQRQEDELLDCIVVGGGPAGLGAALLLARSRRKVAVFDSGNKRNEASLVQHAVLGADGATRRTFLESALEQVKAYPTVTHRQLSVCAIDVLARRVECVCSPDGGGGGAAMQGDARSAGEDDACALTDGRRITCSDGFVVHTEDGRQWRARKVVLATGVRDLLPDVEGFADYWGRGVQVCLYCDAFEYSGQALGAYGNGERGVHIAFEMLLWSRDVTLFTDGQPLEATEQERQLLRREGVRVIETRIARCAGDGSGHLAGLVLRDGCFVPLRALWFNTGRTQASSLPQKMGLPVDDRGDIQCEVKGSVRSMHGLYVAGNCASSPLKLVQTAASQGLVTGAKVNSELMYEELGLEEGESDRITCSLDGSRTTCQAAYSAPSSPRACKPTAGGPEEKGSAAAARMRAPEL